MKIDKYVPIPCDGQSTVSKAADIAIWYKNNGGLKSNRIGSICLTWGVTRDELKEEIGGRGNE